MWAIFAFLSGVSKSGGQIFTKYALRHFSSLEVSLYSQLIPAVFLSLIIFLFGIKTFPEIEIFYFYITLVILLTSIAIIACTHAMKISELSNALPFLAFIPLFAILPNWYFNGEKPSIYGVLGILIIVCGALFSGAKNLKDLLSLRGARIFKEKGVLLVLMASFLYAINLVPMKRAILQSSPIGVAWWITFGRTVVIAISTLAVHKKIPRLAGKIKHSGPLLVLGLFRIGEFALEMTGLQSGYAAYVIGLKRVGNIFTWIGGYFLFNESFNRYKTIGIALMTIGAGIILYFS